MKYRIFAAIMTLIFVASFSFAAAPEKQDNPGQSDKKEVAQDVLLESGAVMGEVVSFYPKDAPKYIGVSSQDDNADYYFLIDMNSVKVINKKALQEIMLGDVVEIIFDKVQRAADAETGRTESQAKSIRFIRQAVKDDALKTR